MDIVFIGHTYHKRTQSSAFFLDILQSFGIVQPVWDDGVITGKQMEVQPDWDAADLIVVWQIEYIVPKLVQKGLGNILFVPMFDGAEHLTDAYWSSIKNVRILCFSSTLYNRVQKCGISNSAYFQYFPNPRDHQCVDHSSELRVYLWQRREQPSWETVKAVIGGQPCESVTLKAVHDPIANMNIQDPSLADVRRFNIRRVGWTEAREDVAKELRKSNVFFAPRLAEGIGMSFLEAMAAGMCVCANDYPTMNEYIVNGCNGYLYRLPHIGEIDLSRHLDVGLRARAFIEAGYRRWERDRERLEQFIRGACSTQKSIMEPRRTGECATRQLDSDGLMNRSGGVPRVTVAVVTKNAATTLDRTLQSIISQDYPNLELIVVDGASTDSTAAVLSGYRSSISCLVSEPDEGPYYAMNRAAVIGSGEWIVFINSGDMFYSTTSLSDMVEGAPDDADFIIAHHLYRLVSGIEEIHYVRPFAETWEDLRSGNVSHGWLAGIPCHQSTLTRRKRLVAMQYDTSYRIAADHELMFRAYAAGAKFFVVPFITAIYCGGGMSARMVDLCVKEWWQIGRIYSRGKWKVDRFYRMISARAKISSRTGYTLTDIRHMINCVSLPFRPLVLVIIASNMARNRAQRIVIDLRRENYDGTSVRLTGFSISEGWGRWTDGYVAKAEWATKVSGRVRVTLLSRNLFHTNFGEKMVVMVGGKEKSVILGRWKRVIVLEFEDVRDCSELIFVIPKPACEAGAGPGGEKRQLGLGLSLIEIVASQKREGVASSIDTAPSVDVEDGAEKEGVEVVDGRRGPMKICINDNIVSGALKYYGEWAEHEIKILSGLANGGSVLDIGAYLGTHSVGVVDSARKVVSVEANGDIIPILRENCDRLGNGKIDVVHAGVGSKGGVMWMSKLDRMSAGNYGHGQLHAVPLAGREGESVVAMVTIDELVGRYRLHDCAIIKIDVEGMEKDVLVGATETLRTQKPFILAEMNCLEEGVPAYQFMKSLGYRAIACSFSAYNDDNFRNNKQDMFYGEREIGVLYCPGEIPEVVNMSGIIGKEIKSIDDFVGVMLTRRQYIADHLSKCKQASWVRSVVVETRSPGEEC
jgi:FkbM family methyltransferase